MYSAREAAKITGLTTAALRYYERENLLPPIKRTGLGYRQYSDTDIEWIKMIQCLRFANVQIQSIKKYIFLLLQGGKTIEERLCMVKEYQETLTKELEHIQSAMKLTNAKLAFYNELSKDQLSRDFSYLEEWELFKNWQLIESPSQVCRKAKQLLEKRE